MKNWGKWIGSVAAVLSAAAVMAAEAVPMVNVADTKAWTIGNRGAISADGSVIKITQPGQANCKLPVYPIDGGQDIMKTYQGISFRVRGDGSDEWGCLTISTGPRTGGGSFYFPVKNTDWVEYTVAFADMAPAGDHSCVPPRDLAVGEICQLGLGDYWQIRTGNEKRSPFQYEIADLKLLPTCPLRFSVSGRKAMPLTKAIAMMKSGKDVRILCFGDSITAGTGLKNRATESYHALIGPALAEYFKNPKIVSCGAATGGAHTYQSIGWMDRDLQEGGIPDIATMLIGYNNRSSDQSADMYRQQLEVWVQRLIQQTQGKCAIVLIPTVPGVPRFLAQDAMAAATREVAAKYGCAVAPLDTMVKAIGPTRYRREYLGDGVHPNAAGHKMYAAELVKVLSGQKK